MVLRQAYFSCLKKSPVCVAERNGWVRRINGETVSVGNNAVKLLVALAIGLRRAAQKLLEFNSSYPVGSLFEVCLCYGRIS